MQRTWSIERRRRRRRRNSIGSISLPPKELVLKMTVMNRSCPSTLSLSDPLLPCDTCGRILLRIPRCFGNLKLWVSLHFCVPRGNKTMTCIASLTVKTIIPSIDHYLKGLKPGKNLIALSICRSYEHARLWYSRSSQPADWLTLKGLDSIFWPQHPTHHRSTIVICCPTRTTSFFQFGIFTASSMC